MKKNGTILHRPARTPGLHAVMSRFGAPLGRRFTRNNLALLAQVHAAYTALRRSTKAIRGRGANIFTQWVGDPDALGSAVMLRAILQVLGAKEVRILTGALGHPQNRNLVERCGIELQDPNEERLPRGLHCTVDTSPPLGMSNTGRVDPVTEFFFVADHHADPDDVEKDCRDRGVRRVKLAFVGLPVGSTSAFLSALGMAFDVWETLGPAGRAAAALGIYTDTNALLHGATPLDFRMFEKLTRDEQTQEILDDLRDYRVPPEWQAYRAAAFRNLESTGTVRIAPVGYVRADHRDVIAEIANEVLRIEGTSIAVAVAVTERGHRGLDPRRQPPARPRSRAHRPRGGVPAELRVPRRVGFQARAPAAPPRRRGRLRSPQRGAGAPVGAGRSAAWRRSGPGPRPLPRLRAGPHRRAAGPEVRPPRRDPGSAVAGTRGVSA